MNSAGEQAIIDAIDRLSEEVSEIRRHLRDIDSDIVHAWVQSLKKKPKTKKLKRKAVR